MNAVLIPAGLPAYLAYASCHSVSNHPPMAARLFFRSRFLSALARCPGRLPRLDGEPPARRRGLRNGLRTALAGSSHRLAESSLRCSCMHELCYGLAVHLRQLPTPCRHGAVAFGHRPVILGLTGIFTPLCKRLHRRTNAGFSRQKSYSSPGENLSSSTLLSSHAFFLRPLEFGPCSRLVGVRPSFLPRLDRLHRLQPCNHWVFLLFRPVTFLFYVQKAVTTQ